MILPILKRIQAAHAAKNNALATGPSALGEAAPVVVAGPSAGSIVYGALSTLSMAASTYHGYKRHEHGEHPLAFALLWGFMGLMFPVITPVIGVAQGFAEPLPEAQA